MSAPLVDLVDSRSVHPAITIPGRIAVPGPARAFTTAGLARNAPGPILAVVPTEREAEELAGDLALFTDQVWTLPAWETLPFEHVSPNVATMARRCQARHLLAEGSSGRVVVASARAVIQRVSPSDPRPLKLQVGQETDFQLLVEKLDELGYSRVDPVQARGEFAVRGGILDVFPAQDDQPVRVDFWGDRVEELRLFSIGSQRSVGKVDEIEIFPAGELRLDESLRTAATLLRGQEPWAASTWDRLAAGVRFPGMESWLPWLAPAHTLLEDLGADTILLLFDPVGVRSRSQDLMEEERDLAKALSNTWGESRPRDGEPPALFLDVDMSQARGEILHCPPLPTAPGDPVIRLGALDATPGDPESVAAGLRKLLAQDFTVVLALDGEPAATRVARILEENGLALPVVQHLNRGNQSAVIATGVHAGMVLPSAKTAVLGEREIAGRRRAHRRPGRRTARTPNLYKDLAAGDYVVHHHHGIGRFEGLETNAMAGVTRDYIIIGYAGGDKLYVPTDQLAAVKKYVGGETPRVSKMGGSEWAATRSKVKNEAAVVADHVIEMFKARASAPGRAFSPDSPWQKEVEDAFPYEETPDQLAAIVDVKQDMEAPDPMDRLVFGDVGFGKTEVAIRAAFKAVTDGFQAAVLCPTTLLAQQHQQVFSERFASYPVKVAMLSRFLTSAQIRQVLADIKTGAADVVIGTHRLLSNDVKFHKLGLLVVDEEHRFGVKAKEKIKAMRLGVDVLTLTATPIPRTLEMALTGIREVSHLRTPPEDRHPILTYVGPYDEQVVSAAIRRELLREGQIFYVHNQIRSMDHALTRLQELVPDARYATAHGRMSEGQLEQVMLDFWDGRYDVLVSTTIIESGLDLPAVNTLIVERADLLGLAGLYQLRGRVGRSHRRAYAYLFHPDDFRLPEGARQRLAAVGEHADLGSGLEIARRDLEIRGAGSVLGEVQSGHIAAVGFDLYAELVSEAVAQRMGTQPVVQEVKEVRIDLAVDAHLPTDYVAEQNTRLEAYRRLADALTLSEVDEVAEEWEDRYGPLPPASGRLIKMAQIRVEALRIGLTEILAARGEIRLAPVGLSDSQQVRLQRLAPGGLWKAGEERLFVPVSPRQDRLDFLLDFLQSMWPDGPSPGQ